MRLIRGTFVYIFRTIKNIGPIEGAAVLIVFDLIRERADVTRSWDIKYFV